MIPSKEQLQALANVLHQHTGLQLSTIGTYGANDGKIFKRWEEGGGCTLRTAELLLRWFSTNWPEDLAWPRDIPRPPKSKVAA